MIDKPIGRPRKKIITKRNNQKKNKTQTKDKRIKELENELLYLKAENAYFKGLRELTLQKKKIQSN